MQRKNAFKAKLSSFIRMKKIYEVLLSEREAILLIKNVSPDGKLPRGLL